jgi:seryl-tRNA synthetase
MSAALKLQEMMGDPWPVLDAPLYEAGSGKITWSDAEERVRDSFSQRVALIRDIRRIVASGENEVSRAAAARTARVALAEMLETMPAKEHVFQAKLDEKRRTFRSIIREQTKTGNHAAVRHHKQLVASIDRTMKFGPWLIKELIRALAEVEKIAKHSEPAAHQLLTSRQIPAPERGLEFDVAVEEVMARTSVTRAYLAR